MIHYHVQLTDIGCGLHGHHARQLAGREQRPDLPPATRLPTPGCHALAVEQKLTVAKVLVNGGRFRHST